MKVLSKFSLMLAIVAILTIGALGPTAASDLETEENVAMDPGGVGHSINPYDKEGYETVAYGTVTILSDPGGVGH